MQSSNEASDFGKRIPKKEENDDDENSKDGQDDKNNIFISSKMATTADIQLGDAQLYTDNLHLCIQAGGEQLSFYHGVNREAKVKTLMNTIKLRIEGLRKKVLLMNGQFVAGALANITFRFQDVIQYTNAAQHLFLAGYNFTPL